MTNEPNNKKRLTERLKKEIQKSVENSFEKNVGGRRKTENAGIRELEKQITDDFRESDREGKENYENVKRNAGGGFAGGVAGNRKTENPRIRDFEKRALDKREEYMRKGSAMKDKLRSGKERLQNPATRQAETRRIKENIKKSVKEKGKKIEKKTKKNINKRKVALKSKLKERAKKKLSMNAQKGKSGCITILFIIAFFLALLNDSLDVIATIVAWVIGLLFAGVGVAVTAPAIEIILDVIDVITTFLLVAFSLYVGGKTKGNAINKIKPLLRCVGGAALEMIPIVNLFCCWVVVVLMNWHEARKRATEAEKMQQR